MKSILLFLDKIDRLPIPFEYNYLFSISIYNKLRLYQENIATLHAKNMQDLHTFSSIISRNLSMLNGGIDFKNGFIVVRSLDDRIVDYLKIGLSLDNILYISKSKIVVKSVKELPTPNFHGETVKFKSLSPALIRDYKSKKNFVINDDVSENLAKSIVWSMERYYGSKAELPKIEKYSYKIKTVRVSNNGTILNAVLLNGQISGKEELLKFAYFKGFGSKTGLGLGCWEVVEE